MRHTHRLASPGASVRRFLGVLVLYPLLFTAFLFALPTPRDEVKGAKAADRFGAVGPRFAIVGAAVFDGKETLEKQTIVCDNGRIVDVGTAIAVPEGVAVVDGKGLTVLPGLVDAHTHVFFDAAKDALAFGVTTELDMFSVAEALAGFRTSREDLANGSQADVFSSGILATPPKGHGTEYGLPVPTLTKAEEADAWVAARVAEGSDYIKIVIDDGSTWGITFATLDRATVGALVRAAHARKRLAVVHVSTLAGARIALEEGADGLAHVFGDEPADASFLKLAKEKKAFVVATLSVLESISATGGNVLADPDLSPYLRAGQRESLGKGFRFTKKGSGLFERAVANVRLLKEAGVPILAGTDSPNPGTAHGASLHRELELLVSAGLTPIEALRAATSLPAERFGIPERGRIAKGMRADLVLVSGDPTADIKATRKIAAIYKNGHFVKRERVDPSKATAPKIEPGLLGDFEDGTTKGGFGSGWQETTDGLRGGSSKAKLAVVDGGAGATLKALRVEGEIAAGYAYPWAGAIFVPGTPPFTPVDASARRELVFFTRGDGRKVRVLLFTKASQIPIEKVFETKDAWTEITIPLADATGADTKNLQGIAFSASADPGTFRFELDRVELR